jgi:nicotinate-nucleotide adenylyltransferase
MSPTLALFGTSADPPTFAHRAILQWLSPQFDQVIVWAADNPFKTDQTPLEHRQVMLEMLVAEIQISCPNVSHSIELGDSRTLNTVERTRQRWPDAELTLVVGSDVIPKLPHWYRAADLLSQVNLLILYRPGVALAESDLDALRQKGATVKIANFTGPQISSSDYREQGSMAGLTTAIANYIHQQGLYQWAESESAAQAADSATEL